jgi:hypothetical protein
MKAATTCLAALLVAAGPACGAKAADRSDWSVPPAKLELGDGWTARLGGAANLTIYTADQGGAGDRSGGTVSALVFPRLEKLFANGWRLGVRSTLNVYHDELSGDNYGNDFFQKAYLFLETPYGRFELGQQDGAAFKMSVTGPAVAEDVALDDADIVFFRDPVTGDALTEIFKVRSAVFATTNAAKISYYSPRLFGIRIGMSFTPHMAKDVLPYVSSGPHVPDRQENLFEGAINYTGFFGRTSVGAYAGFAAGHDAHRTAGHDDLFDWGLGAEVDEDLGGPVLAFGGAYRESNGYTLEPGAAFRTGTTRAVHLSTKLTLGAWQFGLEYLNGVADAEALMPKLDIAGYEVGIAYAINSNLRLTGGWQHQRFTRSTGTFYTGGRALDLDAAFLYLRVHV